jgi:hypothetical protein
MIEDQLEREALGWLADVGYREWLAVKQFSITGPRHTRRPDIVLFVNGLPLVLIELKNPAGRVEGVPADPDLQGTDPRRLPLQRGAGDCWRRPLALQVC